MHHPRLDDPEPQVLRGGDHPVVVGDDRIQVVAKLSCGREMNRVQRAKCRRAQHAGGVQAPVVHADEIDALDHGAAACHRLVSSRQEGS